MLQWIEEGRHDGRGHTHPSLPMSRPQARPARSQTFPGLQKARRWLMDSVGALTSRGNLWGAPSQLQSPRSVFEAARKPSPCD